MHEQLLINITLIFGLGVGGAWLCSILKFPPIVFYLLVGFLVGPCTRCIDVDKVLGELLMPLSSILVAVILFEGGLTLKLKELTKVGRSVLQLNTIGVAINWIILTFACNEILELPITISMLLSSILIVTGPTTIKPLLKHLRLKGNVGSVVKWEGIVIEPIGATFAMILLHTLFLNHTNGELPTYKMVVLALKTIVIGFSVGTASASFLIYALKANWIQDTLKNSVTLMIVVLAFTTSDLLQESAGFLSAAIIGIILTNQKFTPIKRILNFEHDLSVFIIPSLFIVLASRLNFNDLVGFNSNIFIFLAIVFFVARPIAILISTLGTNLELREKLFLCLFAPRGILAAAVVSLFSLQLITIGYENTNHLISITFVVIIATVTIYSMSAKPLAKFLNLSDTDPQGVLIVGAHKWARDLAKLIKDEGINVLIVDTNRKNITDAKLESLPTYYGNILSEEITDELDLTGIGKLFSLTSNLEVNSLSAIHFSEYFGTNNVYQVLCQGENKTKKDDMSKDLLGRTLFGENISFDSIQERLTNGGKLKTVSLTEKFDFDEFKLKQKDNVIPLCLITEDKKLEVYSGDYVPSPKPNQKLIFVS